MDKLMQQRVRERFEEINKRITVGSEDKLSALLSPEPFNFDTEKLSSKVRFKNKEWQKNQRGELHGGAIAAMFDTAMGMSVVAFSDGKDVSTADLNVSFIRPFRGESYVFEVEIVHPGRRIVRTTAKAYDEDSGKCLASATGNFVFIKK